MPRCDRPSDRRESGGQEARPGRSRAKLSRETDMSRFKTAVMLLGVLFLAWAAQPIKAADQTEIKRLMGDNFQIVQDILIGLLTAHYEKLPEKVNVIRDHAFELSKSVPQTVPPELHRTFVAYAFNLEQKAGDLNATLSELIRHDRQRTDPVALNIDYLRAVTASQFGELVTTCVLCHNQFRRKSVP